jgi:hypothetical protein
MTKTRGNGHCGFYPGSHPGEHQDGTAASFDEARSDFEAAWKIFLAKRTEAFRRGVASKIGPLENMRCGKPAKTTIAETKYADEVRMPAHLFNGAKSQRRLQDLSDSAIKSGLGGNDKM